MSKETSNYLEGIKLISFDIWSTLLKSNPEYKKKRLGVLYEMLGASGIDLDQLGVIFKEVDDSCDQETEITGNQYGLSDRVRMIYERLPEDGRIANLSDEKISEIDEALAVVLKENLPQIIEDDLLVTLEKLDKQGIMIAVISNTGFIDGRHMRIVLERLGILPFLKLQIFSNEVGAAKPSKKIFQALIEKTGIEGKMILHVGDNLVADYEGAVKAGIKALHLNQNDSEISIKAIRELLE